MRTIDLLKPVGGTNACFSSYEEVPQRFGHGLNTQKVNVWRRRPMHELDSRVFFKFFFLGVMALAAVSRAPAHTCPPNAVSTGVGMIVTAFDTNGVKIGTNFVAPCQPIELQMTLVFLFIDPLTGEPTAAFENGSMQMNVQGVITNVTPLGGVPLIGGDGTPGCDGPSFFRSIRLPYTVTQADAALGLVYVEADYFGGDAHVGETNLLGVVSASQAFQVRVRPSVSCTVAPLITTTCAAEAPVLRVSNQRDGTVYLRVDRASRFHFDQCVHHHLERASCQRRPLQRGSDGFLRLHQPLPGDPGC